MKKLIALSLLLVALGSMAFADTATVLPAMVGRVRLVPAFMLTPGIWDDKGKKDSFDNTQQVFNLGLALEFGIIDWITAAVLWAPGWTPWSSNVMGQKDVTVNGVADMMIGAKFLILGEKAPIENDMFRFAVTAGVLVPLPGPDVSKEYTKSKPNMPIDKHVFGIGAWLDFDWLINESFTLNFHNDTRIYPIKQDLKNSMDYAIYGTAIATAMLDPDAPNKVKINHKYSMDFELEGSYSMPLADGIILNAGLPVAYSFTPGKDYSGGGFSMSGKSGYVFSVKPNVGVFLTNTPLPMEFVLQYGLPLVGKNAAISHVISLQFKTYFALPGADI